MKSVFVVAVMTVAVSAASAAVVDLQQARILPREVARFQVRAACAPGDAASVCRELATAAPTLTFRLREAPTGLDDADREALRVSATPMTAVLGAPITQAEALALLGSEICGRRIFETDATDQYGGAWALTPYMYQADGRWVHRWTVTPRFAGYRTSAADGRARVEVVQAREQLEREKGPGRGFLDKYFPGNPFR